MIMLTPHLFDALYQDKNYQTNNKFIKYNEIKNKIKEKLFDYNKINIT